MKKIAKKSDTKTFLNFFHQLMDFYHLISILWELSLYIFIKGLVKRNKNLAVLKKIIFTKIKLPFS